MRNYSKTEVLAMDPTTRFALAKGELGIPNVALMGDNEVLNSVLARLSQDGRLQNNAAPAGAPAGAPAAPAQIAPVRVVCTPYDQSFPDLVGRTAAQAIESLREAFNLEPNMRVYVNGERIMSAASTPLKAGDTMEMMRAAGEKGSACPQS